MRSVGASTRSECRAGKIRTASAANDGGNAVSEGRRRHDCSGGSRARPKQAEWEVLYDRLPLDPMHEVDDPPGEHGDIEYIGPISLLARGEPIEQQSRHAAAVQ
jgi:hypothetical protein